MNENAAIVRDIQEKIDRIVSDALKLFQRLDVVMASTAVFDLLSQHGSVLRHLRPLCVNLPCPISASILGGIVTDRSVTLKREELHNLTGEVVEFFERLRNVLAWNAVFDICSARGKIVILPEGHHEPLRIFDVYCDHLEALHEERLREEMLQELDSSSSSIDSYHG